MATKRRSAIKKRIVPTKENKRQMSYDRDYKIALKQVQKVNDKLKSLEKKFSKGKGTWSVKLLRDKLDTDKIGIYKNNRLILNKNLTRTQLIAIQKETSRFLKRKTSTKKGVNEVREKTKESLYNTLKLQDDDLTIQDIDDFYSILGDEDAKSFLKTDIMGASALEVAVTDAIKYQDSVEMFINRFESFITIADVETYAKVERLYKKYVEPKVYGLDEEDLSYKFGLY